jgi:hypothetical protein
MGRFAGTTSSSSTQLNDPRSSSRVDATREVTAYSGDRFWGQVIRWRRRTAPPPLLGALDYLELLAEILSGAGLALRRGLSAGTSIGSIVERRHTTR